MKEEKLEQLRKIFSEAVKDIIRSVKNGYENLDSEKRTEQYAKAISNNLVYEVKIRINNK